MAGDETIVPVLSPVLSFMHAQPRHNATTSYSTQSLKLPFRGLERVLSYMYREIKPAISADKDYSAEGGVGMGPGESVPMRCPQGVSRLHMPPCPAPCSW